MANETLSIQKDDARLTVIGKSKADVYINSGLGLDLGDLDIGSLDPLDLNWQTDVPDPDNLPDEIRIITPPTKLTYTDGEKLNLDGMVVGAYKNNTIWTNAKYTNGHIPLGELMINPLVVSELPYTEVLMNSIQKVYIASSLTIIQTTHYGDPYADRIRTYTWECIEGEDVYFAVWYVQNDSTRRIYGVQVFSTQPATIVKKRNQEVLKTYGLSSYEIYYKPSTYSPDGRPVYLDRDYDALNIYYPYDPGTEETSIPMSGLFNNDWYWRILYDVNVDKKDPETIQLSWARPVDRQILDTSFDISII